MTRDALIGVAWGSLISVVMLGAVLALRWWDQ